MTSSKVRIVDISLVTIRPLTIDDATSCKIQIECLLRTLSKKKKIKINSEWIEASLASESTVVLGAFDRFLIGLSIANFKQHFTGFELYVDDVAVSEAWQNEGVGTLLMEVLEKLAQERGCSSIMFTSSRPDAQKFYTKRGYRKRDTEMFEKKL